MNIRRPVLVRVFAGPSHQSGNEQLNCFEAAWSECNLFKDGGASKETLYHSEIITWLRESDIHIILCHMHQGKKHQIWDCLGLNLALFRLDNHLGFPMAELLSCPIFTQNKLNYLSALRDSDRINFTLPISLKSLQKYCILPVNG